MSFSSNLGYFILSLNIKIKRNTVKKIINQIIWVIGAILIHHLTFANSLQAIDQEMYPTNINYDATIPSPQTFLGRPLGSAPIRHHELVDYLKLVASLSNRLTIETIGFSHERRPILFVVATSESNQDNIDAIKKQHIALTEPKLNQNVKKNMPVVHLA